MRKFLLCLAIWPLWVGGAETQWTAQSEEEALFLRRIADFWAEGEYQMAKSQMEEFLASFPESSFSDSLCATLGDLYLREKNHPAALEFYARIRDVETSARVFLNRMQCLYHMEWYATLAEECDAFLKKEDLTPVQKIYTTYYLAISLYQQCLNAEKNSEALTALARRAEPHFEVLLQSELSGEVAQAFAHLSCILKNFPKAAAIYGELAQKNPEEREEFLFQKALAQSEYDRGAASETFQEIGRMGQKRAKEATFNRLVLAFETGQFAPLIENREVWLQEVPPERQSAVHLFLGRSHLALKHYREACAEFELYLVEGAPCDTFHAALISLLDAAFQSNDLVFLDFAIQKMKTFYPEDPEIAKGIFSRALILKKGHRIEEARQGLEELLATYPQFPQVPQALFELAHLDYQEKKWAACREKAHAFLAKYRESDLAPYAWHYLASASVELTNENPQSKALKEQLAYDLERLLREKKGGDNQKDQKEWTLLLAKTNFELHCYEEAIALLEPLTQEANAKLLLALCYRDGLGDLSAFCRLGEEALQEGTTLMDPGPLHACLFNGYLERSAKDPELLETAAHHLFASFEAKTPLQKENLAWLSERYFQEIAAQEELGQKANPQRLHQTAQLLEHLHREAPSAATSTRLGKVYLLLGNPQGAIEMLESMPKEESTLLLLGEAYAAIGQEEKAIEMFEQIATEPATLRRQVGAAASLYSARLHWKRANCETALTRLKDLVLQKTLANEPLHLEAALDYIEFQSGPDREEKRVNLLRKTKEDFETQNDLLSKDYHEARGRFEKKNRVYQAYLRFFEAEIYAAESKLCATPEEQKELQAKAKDLLLLIIEENAHSALTVRAARALEQWAAASQ